MSKPVPPPPAAEVEAAVQAMLTFQLRKSIKEDIRGLATAALAAAATVRRQRRSPRR
jgi:hypothetical protein